MIIEKNRISIYAFLLLLFYLPGNVINAQSIEENFKNPSSSYKPKTWMHAMSANMSKEGLTEDLESMAQVGIGGLLLFNVTQGIPYGTVPYASEKHIGMISHAAAEAERLGLSFGVHNCDGWSSSGGPWVTPEQSMKMVVWRDTVVQGGAINCVLPQPTRRNGLFKDIAVLAYPALEVECKQEIPTLSSSDTTAKLSLINDQLNDIAASIKASKNEKPWIQYGFRESKNLCSFWIILENRDAEGTIYTSDDGLQYEPKKTLEKIRTGKGEWVLYLNSMALKAQYYRVVFNDAVSIKEAYLSERNEINNIFGRTAMGRTEAFEFTPIGNPDSTMIIDKSSILNLTKYLDAAGNLKTTLPAGKWTIMRFGYTSTGAINWPSSKDGKGLEVDKLNREAFKHHYDAFVKRVIDASKPKASNALQYVEIDSYEMGGQNWTNAFDSIFKAKKDYDLISFLPIVAGRFVESALSSEKVLEDYREVVSNLMTENYFGYFQELCHADGLKTYIEPYGFGPLNDLDVGAKADLPMGEFWMNRPINMVSSAVSSAHIYGRKVISAESFTSTPEINWKGHPGMAKISGDRAWVAGINEFMFHRFAHQANTHVEPGMTMNRWGFHFDRTQTWWQSSGADWFRYIARGSYLLQQGVPVSDILIFIGDGTPNGTVNRNAFDEPIPSGYQFDCTNADVLINRIKIKNGLYYLPEGTQYRMLVLHNSKAFKWETLLRIRDFVSQGGVVVGTRPTRLLGYGADEKHKGEFQQIVNEIWTKPNVFDHFRWKEIFSSVQLSPDMEWNHSKPVQYIHRALPDKDIYFTMNDDSIPRNFQLKCRVEGMVPELWNPMNGEIIKTAQFESKGQFTYVSIDLKANESVFVVFKKNPNTRVSVLPSSVQDDVQYYYTPSGAIKAISISSRVLTPQLSNGKNLQVKLADIPKPTTIQGTWQVSFLKTGGQPKIYKFDKLTDWSQHPDEFIKYYSGPALYSHSFLVTKDLLQQKKLILNLGDLMIAATVKVNGKKAGVVWMPPFELDITEFAKEGSNHLEIEVVNQWSNKLIGDERFPKQDDGYQLEGAIPTGNMPLWYTNNLPMPAGPRTTFTTAPFYKANDPLMPSGLLGPVTFSSRVVVDIK